MSDAIAEQLHAPVSMVSVILDGSHRILDVGPPTFTDDDVAVLSLCRSAEELGRLP